MGLNRDFRAAMLAIALVVGAIAWQAKVGPEAVAILDWPIGNRVGCPGEIGPVPALFDHHVGPGDQGGWHA